MRKLTLQLAVILTLLFLPLTSVLADSLVADAAMVENIERMTQLLQQGKDVNTAQGDGMVNAAFVALQDAFETAATLLDYRVNPVTAGADAMAEVNVIIQVGANTYSGRGVSTDVVEGSARAFVSALNKVLIDRGGVLTGDGS